MLKNFQAQRYNILTRIGSVWKLLLTGTPLQNNLQELVVCYVDNCFRTVTDCSPSVPDELHLAQSL